MVTAKQADLHSVTSTGNHSGRAVRPLNFMKPGSYSRSPLAGRSGVRQFKPVGTAKHWLLGLVLILLSSIVGVWLGKSLAIRELPKLLARSDLPEQADVIVVLGGNYDTRIPLAVALYKRGFAPKILLFREPTGHSASNTRLKNFTDVSIGMLERAGVPEQAIVHFSPGVGVKSTADEARAFGLYARIYPVHRVLIVTSSFHCFRARMTFRRALASQQVDVRVMGAESPLWTTQNWYGTDYGRRQVRLESLKTVYYFLTFFG